MRWEPGCWEDAGTWPVQPKPRLVSSYVEALLQDVGDSKCFARAVIGNADRYYVVEGLEV